MRVERDWLRELVFEAAEARRFTQDSPILPEVWLSGGVAYCRAPYTRVDLLLWPEKQRFEVVDSFDLSAACFCTPYRI